MCSRQEARQAQEAQDRAAEALVHACHGTSDQVGNVLAKIYEDTLSEPLPEDFGKLVERLQ